MRGYCRLEETEEALISRRGFEGMCALYSSLMRAVGLSHGSFSKRFRIPCGVVVMAG